MNQDDIIRMAREACDTDKVDAWMNGFWTLTQEELERFANFVYAAGATAEREACAKVCDAEVWRETQNQNTAEVDGVRLGARFCAAAIRARGQSNV
jgi:hypothetical protein